MEINENNLKFLCRGAAFLGSGGGGDVNNLYPLVINLIKKNGPIPLIEVTNIKEEGLILGIECIGAPVPKNKNKKKLTYSFESLINIVQNDLNMPITAVMPIEIGGSNALTPLCVAHQLSTCVLDGDLLGRAFPEIPMVTLSLFDMFPRRTYISSPDGLCANILNCENYGELEQKAREYASQNENYTALLVSAILHKKDLSKVVIPNTISLAMRIGEQETLSDLLKTVNGKIIAQGKVTDTFLQIMKGFLVGNVTIMQGNDQITVYLKNEFLKVESNQTVLAKSPDIISILDPATLNIIQSEQIQKDQEVIIISAPGPDIWYTETGLKLVGNIDLLATNSK